MKNWKNGFLQLWLCSWCENLTLNPFWLNVKLFVYKEKIICFLILNWHVAYCSFFRPGLSSIVTGYLPSVVLKGFIYVVPFAMFAMAKVAGCVARSKEEIKACNMVFYFLVGNVFFVSVLSGSLLDTLGKFISRPKSIPNELATAVSAQVWYFHFCHSWHFLSNLHHNFERRWSNNMLTFE